MGAVSGSIVIGVDLGQKRDPTAIAVVEIEHRRGGRDRGGTHFAVRYLGRLPLGTPYPEVVRRVAEVVLRAREQSGAGRPVVYVDATGVGQPIIDLMTQQRIPGTVTPVCFTHGDRRRRQQRGSAGGIALGKAYLVRRLVSLLRAGRLHLPGTSEAQALARELLDYEVRIDQNARDRYGAFRAGTHDDLVTALGLAVQTDPAASLPQGAAATLRPRR